MLKKITNFVGIYAKFRMREEGGLDVEVINLQNSHANTEYIILTKTYNDAREIRTPEAKTKAHHKTKDEKNTFVLIFFFFVYLYLKLFM